MEKQFKSTLDIDTTDKETIKKILLKIIANCHFLSDIDFKFSKCKGVHVILKCTKKCDICRFCYDDFRRFAYDQKRPKYAQNILFDEKEFL